MEELRFLRIPVLERWTLELWSTGVGRVSCEGKIQA
jgi:hypothetical protein